MANHFVNRSQADTMLAYSLGGAAEASGDELHAGISRSIDRSRIRIASKQACAMKVLMRGFARSSAMQFILLSYRN